MSADANQTHPAQVQHAQQLYDAGDHTVQQIAYLLNVRRTTIYGHRDKTTVSRPPTAATVVSNP